jgi:uncharacterized protein YcbX
MNQQQGTRGTVTTVWRYPVKSMLGEELTASGADERGLLGDRAYALIDSATGNVVSAKNPRKWPNLFAFHAAFIDAPRNGAPVGAVRVTLPDGRTVSTDQPEINETLSTALGRAVTVAKSAPSTPSLEEYWPDIDGLAHRETVTDESIAASSPPGTFFDFAAVHVLTTATLDRLRTLYPQGRFDVRRFRPNIVIDTATTPDGFPEKAWVGHTLAIGDSVRLSVKIPCPRCVMTTLAQEDLPRDLGILRTAAQHTGHFDVPGNGTLAALVGVYATVERGGSIRRGDSVRMV